MLFFIVLEIYIMNSIYKISIEATGGFYIGSTNNIIKRKSQHKRELLNNEHHCLKLQEDFNQHGIESFKFEVLLDNIDSGKLRPIEYVYIQSEEQNPKCYNVFTENTPPQEVKDKIGLTLIEHYKNNAHPRLGKKHTHETIEKIKANRIAPKGEAHYNFGKIRSEETRRKISEAQIGKKRGPHILTPEGRSKIKAAAELGHYSHWQGKTHTEESKAKMSKPIKELSQSIAFTSLTNALQYYSMLMPTLTRALKTGKPILKGDKRGLQFVYIEHESVANESIVNPNLSGKLFISTPADYTKCSIEGCDKPYAANGFCMYHYKKDREAKKSLEL